MTQRTNFSGWNSGFARAIDVIGEWWTPIVIRSMFLGITKFEALQENLGIARNILTNRLNGLVKSGIVEKVKYSDRPVRYEYRLTDMGMDLYPAFAAIKQWGDSWLMDGKPSAIPVHEACGNEFTPVVICSECNEEITADEIQLKRGPGFAAPTGYDTAPFAPEE